MSSTALRGPTRLCSLEVLWSRWTGTRLGKVLDPSYRELEITGLLSPSTRWYEQIEEVGEVLAIAELLAVAARFDSAYPRGTRALKCDSDGGIRMTFIRDFLRNDLGIGAVWPGERGLMRECRTGDVMLREITTFGPDRKLEEQLAEEITPEMTLGEIVTQRPELARELEKRSLDYCCGGARSLAEACSSEGLDAAFVAHELSTYETAGPADWAGMDLGELVDHIVKVHHTYVREELPRLSALASKVNSVHGDRHAELAEIERLWNGLRRDLEMHLTKEEEILFPMIHELIASQGPVEFHCGSLQNPIRVMLMEHDSAGELLGELRRLTNDFTPPADGCESYRALYSGLNQFERDLHMHIHKENNLLFPGVIELEGANA